MLPLFHPKSPFRIFVFSVVSSLAILLAVFAGLGTSALLITLILVIIEITFSFENAIINAKILQHLSRFWQNIFLTIGIVIAIFGMRIVFPIAIVSITAGLGWQEVLNLALNDPDAYAEKLDIATPSITAFGGAFLLMLATSFFFDKRRTVHWIGVLEKPMQKVGYRWMPLAITTTAVCAVSFAPVNTHPRQSFIAGIIGILLYLGIHLLSETFGTLHNKGHKKVAKQVGLAAFMSFLYLEILDASFSLDGVIGAFAITNQVLLIAAGLGIGAIWVRSLTIFMVRRGTLKTYRFVEHGAFYTVTILAAVLLLEAFAHIPEAVAGIAGVLVIAASVLASKRYSARA